MASKQDHSKETLFVYPSRTENERWWCRKYGDINVPDGWEFLSPGDAFLTRQVKLMGPHWVAIKPARGYTRTLGIWAPSENIGAGRRLTDETRAQREAKRVVARARRARQEAAYREQFAEAAYGYLNFAPKHNELALGIARAVAEHATEVGSGRVGRTGKLSLERKAMLATRAYIRHNYTQYEDRLFDFGFPLEPGHYLYEETKAEAEGAVDDFLDRHRRMKGRRVH